MQTDGHTHACFAQTELSLEQQEGDADSVTAERGGRAGGSRGGLHAEQGAHAEGSTVRRSRSRAGHRHVQGDEF